MRKAIDDLNQAIAIDPGKALDYIYRARPPSGSEYDLAIADYGEALTIDSENATAFYNRAAAYIAKADLDTPG